MHLFMTDFHFVSPTIITSAHPWCGIAPPWQSPRFGWVTTIPKGVQIFEIPLNMRLHPHREARGSKAKREDECEKGKEG